MTSKITAALARTPAFCYLLPFALLFLSALLFALWKGRRAYFPLALFLLSAFSALYSAKDPAGAVGYFFLLTAWGAACSALFLLPPLKRKKGERGPKKSRDERTFERFYEPLAAPPKVCKFEEPPVSSAEECGMRLGHADELVARLKKVRLSATDRLELDVLERSFDRYRGKPLTEGELRALNDALASVLKLTAKYKL